MRRRASRKRPALKKLERNISLSTVPLLPQLAAQDVLCRAQMKLVTMSEASLVPGVSFSSTAFLCCGGARLTPAIARGPFLRRSLIRLSHGRSFLGRDPIVGGIGLSRVLLRFMSSLLYGVPALAATYMPARRGSCVDPIRALRYE